MLLSSLSPPMHKALHWFQRIRVKLHPYTESSYIHMFGKSSLNHCVSLTVIPQPKTIMWLLVTWSDRVSGCLFPLPSGRLLKVKNYIQGRNLSFCLNFFFTCTHFHKMRTCKNASSLSWAWTTNLSHSLPTELLNMCCYLVPTEYTRLDLWN